MSSLYAIHEQVDYNNNYEAYSNILNINEEEIEQYLNKKFYEEYENEVDVSEGARIDLERR